MKLIHILEQVEWGTKHFGSITTSRQLSRRDILKAIDKRLVRSIGDVTLVDGDDFKIDPERIREGFILTELGENILQFYRKSDKYDCYKTKLENLLECCGYLSLGLAASVLGISVKYVRLIVEKNINKFDMIGISGSESDFCIALSDPNRPIQLIIETT